MYYVLAAVTVLRVLAMAVMIPALQTNLPYTVLIISGLLAAGALFLIIKSFFRGVTAQHLIIYFVAESVAIIFNLTYIAFTSPLSYAFHETLICGNFLNVVINVALILLAFREKRYFTVTQDYGDEGSNSR